MRSSLDPGRSVLGGAGILLAAVLALFAFDADAHKSSDAYLQINAESQQTALRWDIALRDLDVALDLDLDGNGALTWGEIKAAWPRIIAYALSHIDVPGCTLAPTGQGLERRNDGVYAVLHLEGACTLAPDTAIGYSLFADIDPTHRGLARIKRSGQDEVLQMLVPQPPSRTGRSAAAATASAGSAKAPANPGATVSFLREGMHHIFTGYDHLLFLLCLILPAVLRRQDGRWQPVTRLSAALMPVAAIVTAFTVSHSITLALAALRIVVLPSSIIEPAIAVTIMLAALDNVRPFFPVPRAVVALVFGFVHGFGFANVLGELELDRTHFAWALLQFNLGIELGQLAVVAGATALLFAIRNWSRYRLIVLRGGSLAALSIATFWVLERSAISF